MRHLSLLILLTVFSCNKIKETSRETINKSGEIIGESSSEFIDGVSNGIDKKFHCIFEFEGANNQLSTGKYSLAKSGTSNNDILILYVIFNNSLQKEFTVKAIDKEGLEYGRTKILFSGKKDEAKYFDIEFDKRVNLESQTRFIFQ